MIIKAFRVAAKAHKGQKDKAGKPYILHPVIVALRTRGKKQKTVALLHDVIEDTKITIDHLKQSGFDDEVIKAVEAITKRKSENYHDYLCRVKENEISRAVKISDLLHNSNLKRLKTITQSDLDRVKKYKEALAFLKE